MNSGLQGVSRTNQLTSIPGVLITTSCQIAFASQVSKVLSETPSSTTKKMRSVDIRLVSSQSLHHSLGLLNFLFAHCGPVPVLTCT